jgi:hypothetical protein
VILDLFQLVAIGRGPSGFQKSAEMTSGHFTPVEAAGSLDALRSPQRGANNPELFPKAENGEN